MVTIADGQEFPRLQRAIEDVSLIFGNTRDLTAIMNDQFDIANESDRARRAQLMAYMVRNEMDRLAIKVNALDDFVFPVAMAQAA